jgi:hypothetical protein
MKSMRLQWAGHVARMKNPVENVHLKDWGDGRTRSGPCPMVGFGISDVQHSDDATTVLIYLYIRKNTCSLVKQNIIL